MWTVTFKHGVDGWAEFSSNDANKVLTVIASSLSAGMSVVSVSGKDIPR